MDRIDEHVLEGANMVWDLFDGEAGGAIERRVAWALDCARIEDAMYWLAVGAALNGEPR
ncbi:hypothetical protein HL653_04850 [Sphingomonas sp. AP4-R1]|uniref:hypothetical protein n=1 Tax=Sphingomonas sp. AP4-R1 TaxID=2735134 RepID=UPI0014934137|nr:hypothetical protein [Sphingomonas sp. AP4-R1]QJU57207.1 hypothetical protein HL653_04850 [Sphingomonas sp. AP4-R1]